MRRIDLSCNSVSETGFRQLFASPHFGELRELNCSSNYLRKGTPKDVPLLVRSAPTLERFVFIGICAVDMKDNTTPLKQRLAAHGVRAEVGHDSKFFAPW